MRDRSIGGLCGCPELGESISDAELQSSMLVLRQRLAVLRVHTRFVRTFVMQFVPRSDRPYTEFVYAAVGKEDFPVHTHLPITAVREFISQPLPATSFMVEFNF